MENIKSENKLDPHINSVIRFRIKSFKKAGEVIYLIKNGILDLSFSQISKRFNIHQYTLFNKTQGLIEYSHGKPGKIKSGGLNILQKVEEVSQIFKNLKKSEKDAAQAYFLYLISKK